MSQEYFSHIMVMMLIDILDYYVKTQVILDKTRLNRFLAGNKGLSFKTGDKFFQNIIFL